MFPVQLMLYIDRRRIQDKLCKTMLGQIPAPLDSGTPEGFRTAVEAVKDYAIFLLDKDGIIRTWNSGAERIKGYVASEIIGKHFSLFYPQDAIDRDWPNQELAIAAREGRFEDEGWRLRKDRSRFWADVIITALYDAEGKVCGFAKVTRDMTEKMLETKRLEESQRRLQQSESALRELSLSLLRTQDNERRRIGRDLHDSVGQYLAVLKLKLDQMSLGNLTIEKARECADLANQTIKEVRTIAYLLYPPMLEENGLKSAIVWFIEGFSARSGIETAINVPEDFGRLPLDYELALFRVLQESLTNVHRHSGSYTANVRLTISRKTIMLEIGDQGKGMSANHLEDVREKPLGTLGVGVRGMTERISQLNGALDIRSTPQGTTVTATVPLPE